MIVPIHLYSIAVTAILIVCVYYLFKGVVTDEERNYILLQEYGSYGKTQEIKKLPFHKIGVVKRTRIISQFSGTPKKEEAYIVEVNPMSHVDKVKLKIK